jgi:hypothetical protein
MMFKTQFLILVPYEIHDTIGCGVGCRARRGLSIGHVHHAAISAFGDDYNYNIYTDDVIKKRGKLIVGTDAT